MTPKVGDAVRCTHREKGTVVEGVVTHLGQLGAVWLEGVPYWFTTDEWLIEVTEPAQPEPSDKAMAVAAEWIPDSAVAGWDGQRGDERRDKLARLIDQHYPPGERLLRDVTAEELAAATWTSWQPTANEWRTKWAADVLDRLRGAK